jgi:hypothetical protein
MSNLSFRICIIILMIALISQPIFCEIKSEKNDHHVKYYYFQGTATNVTFNSRAVCFYTLKIKDDSVFTLDATYDNVNLFGKCTDLKGKVVPRNGDEKPLCIQFSGKIEFGGNDNSGFKEETNAEYLQNVVLDYKGIIGTYSIKTNSELSNFGMDVDQFGTFETAYIFPLNWINGKFKGTGYQTDTQSTWTIDLDCNSSNNQYEIKYPSLGCNGYWEFLSSTENSVTFIEKLTSGKLSCLDKTIITLTKVDDDYITYTGYHPESKKMYCFSTLKRVK